MDEYRLVLPHTISENIIGVLSLFIGQSALPWFNEILQRGFYLTNPVGINIQEFLTKQIGLSRGYIRQKLSTILLDGKIVGDIGSAIIKRGSVLAFSSAMPGFVGASLSIYQSCAEYITSGEISSSDNKGSGVFCV